MNTIIGSLGESSLHASLKELYANPGDLVEWEILGSVVDVFKHSEIVEIQTGSFGKLKSKLKKFLPMYPVRVVLPLALERYVVRVDKVGNEVSRRRSPKKAKFEDLFSLIIHLGPGFVGGSFVLEVVMVTDEVIWKDDGKGSWRRKGWSVADRRLLTVIGQREFHSKADYLTLLPSGLPCEFTVKQLALLGKMPNRLAGKMVYFLKQIQALENVGRDGRANLYRLVESSE